jgi:hypothetical protein
VFGKFTVQISAGTPTFLTGIFCDLFQSLKVVAGIEYFKIDHNQFIPYPFQFIICYYYIVCFVKHQRTTWMAIWDSNFKERMCGGSQNTSENLERDSFGLEILFLWENAHCESIRNFVTWGKIALRFKKSTGTQRNMSNGVFTALNVQSIIWSVLLCCLREVPWLHSASIFNAFSTHFPAYCLLIAPYLTCM